MKLDLQKIFCELLSGTFLLFVLIPILVIADIITLDKVGESLETFDSKYVVPILIILYFLGVLMDAVGLAIGQLYLDKALLSEEEEDEHNTHGEERTIKFWQSVPAHVLEYRDRQWAYYSCYRNLFILIIPGSLAWLICLVLHCYLIASILVLIGFAVLQISLYFSLKALLGIYVSFGKYFESIPNRSEDNGSSDS